MNKSLQYLFQSSKHLFQLDRKKKLIINDSLITGQVKSKELQLVLMQEI